ncbi:photoreceptor ankyrin repeat protein [Gouania willdenowi]|uniref:Photoreceptor ankyrin repeat protein-like n=1 Tax=Gouania willdenowi TaxID=441366 RepID=A0A8C5GX43_GOUWI|nr:photoreceptor ankyrin repeat protein-like [Gouania willdenowi]
MASLNDEDTDLCSGPSEDYDIHLDSSEEGSLFSEDSVFPDYDSEKTFTEPPKTLYEACDRNDSEGLRIILERGVTKEEAMELDINGKNGLMLAVSKGFVDIVSLLHLCPFIDINHQDNDGNTALMIAAQSGFNTILNYILNYYSGVDIETRDHRGFTALIKAGLQGREECVCALLMHGADINAMDFVQGKGLKDWVLKTGRFETLNRLRRLQTRPVALQFSENYIPEWPDLKALVAKATAAKTTSQKLRQRFKDNLSFSFPHDPEDNGVFDHMVRITTSLHSPLVTTGCRPFCPSSPPEIGKRRLAVPELMAKHSKDLETSTVSHSKNGSITPSSPTAVSSTSVSLTSCCQNSQHRDSMPSGSMRGFIPHSMARRNSIFPSGCVPKIEVTKSREPTPKKERKRKRWQKGRLEPPVWKYKEAKEMKKRENKQQQEKEKDEKENNRSKHSSQK